MKCASSYCNVSCRLDAISGDPRFSAVPPSDLSTIRAALSDGLRTALDEAAPAGAIAALPPAILLPASRTCRTPSLFALPVSSAPLDATTQGTAPPPTTAPSTQRQQLPTGDGHNTRQVGSPPHDGPLTRSRSATAAEASGSQPDMPELPPAARALIGPTARPPHPTPPTRCSPRARPASRSPSPQRPRLSVFTVPGGRGPLARHAAASIRITIAFATLACLHEQRASLAAHLSSSNCCLPSSTTPQPANCRLPTASAFTQPSVMSFVIASTQALQRKAHVRLLQPPNHSARLHRPAFQRLRQRFYTFAVIFNVFSIII